MDKIITNEMENEINLNGQVYVLKSELEEIRKKLEDLQNKPEVKRIKTKQFNYNIQLRLIKLLEDLNYSIQDELIELDDKPINITEPSNIFMISSKSEEAKDILWRFANNDNLKPEFSYENFWNGDGGDKIPEFTFSHEYLIKALKILDLTSDDSKIKTKDLSFPIMLENNHFKIVLAPRLKFETDEDETKLYGIK